MKEKSNDIITGKPIQKDVVIIGGGPAGLAVAYKLFDLGVRNIVLFEKEDYLGGVLPQCIHDGFGLTKFGINITGPEYAHLYIQKVRQKKIEAVCCGTVMEVFSRGCKKYVSVVTPDGEFLYESQTVVLATGCRERGRGNLGIPGARLAGIYTAGTAQAFINLKNLMPGRRIVILGSGDIGLIMARRLTLEGAEVLCVVEKEPIAGGLKRNVVQCLEDFCIPLLTNSIVTNICGNGRVEGVEIAASDGSDKRDIPCDTLIISAGLIPEDGILNTNEPGIFFCGNALYVHGLVDDVSNSGEEVARAVLSYLNHRDSAVAIDTDGQISANQSKSVRYMYMKYAVENVPDTREKHRSELAKKRLNDLENAGTKTITCILCPNSCEIDEEFQGGMCEKGAEYAKSEIISPKRVLTSSVKVAGGRDGLVSVRTSRPIPKEKLIEGCSVLRGIEVEKPIHIGDVIIKDFLVEGTDLIATSELL